MKTNDNPKVPKLTAAKPASTPATLLAALHGLTREHLAELEPQVASMPVEWRIALKSVCTESFQSGFIAGVAIMEKCAATQAHPRRPVNGRATTKGIHDEREQTIN